MLKKLYLKNLLTSIETILIIKNIRYRFVTEGVVKIRKWLQEIRQNKNMLHKDVATASGIERAYYTMIENGTRTPSVAIAKRIASALGFDWTYFFDNKSNESKPSNKTA